MLLALFLRDTICEVSFKRFKELVLIKKVNIFSWLTFFWRLLLRFISTDWILFTFYVESLRTEGIALFQKKKFNSSSFEPVPIIEAEERERVALMAQRDFLVRSFRVVDQVSNQSLYYIICVSKTLVITESVSIKFAMLPLGYLIFYVVLKYCSVTFYNFFFLHLPSRAFQ